MAVAQHVATSLLRGVLSGFAGASHKHLASQPLESKRDAAHRHQLHGEANTSNGANGTGGRPGVIPQSPSFAGISSPYSAHGMSHSPAGSVIGSDINTTLYQYIVSTHPINTSYSHTFSPSQSFLSSTLSQMKMRVILSQNLPVGGCCITPGEYHTLSVHPVSPPYQQTLSIHLVSLPCQSTLSTHPVNTPYQHTLSTNLVSPPYQHTLSIHLVSPP